MIPEMLLKKLVLQAFVQNISKNCAKKLITEVFLNFNLKHVSQRFFAFYILKRISDINKLPYRTICFAAFLVKTERISIKKFVLRVLFY